MTAAGTPAELKARVGGERLVVTVADAGELGTAAATLAQFGEDGPDEDAESRQVTVAVTPRHAPDRGRARARRRGRRRRRRAPPRGHARRRLPHAHAQRARARPSEVPHERHRPRHIPAARRAPAISCSTASRWRGRNLQHVRQIPEKLLDVTIQPLMFVLLFAYVFGGVIHVNGGSYREYLIGGVLIQTIAFGIMGPATAIATDLQEGIVDRFRSLPMARSAYILGHLLAELAAATLGIAVLCLSGLIVGWRIHTDLPHALAGFALLLLFAFAMLVARHAARPARPLARRRAGLRLHRRVPDDVHRGHVRAARRAAAACCARSPSTTR